MELDEEKCHKSVVNLSTGNISNTHTIPRTCWTLERFFELWSTIISHTKWIQNYYHKKIDSRVQSHSSSRRQICVHYDVATLFVTISKHIIPSARYWNRKTLIMTGLWIRVWYSYMNEDVLSKEAQWMHGIYCGNIVAVELNRRTYLSLFIWNQTPLALIFQKMSSLEMLKRFPKCRSILNFWDFFLSLSLLYIFLSKTT